MVMVRVVFFSYMLMTMLACFIEDFVCVSVAVVFVFFFFSSTKQEISRGGISIDLSFLFFSGR
jgi:4-amino-4-deoxy-L-arabinose transferase-like glycosyltransferase